MTLALCDFRFELAPYGVRVSTLEPGFFRTPLTTTPPTYLDRQWERLPAHLKREYGRACFDAACAALSDVFAGFCTTKTHLVVDAYFHAVNARAPRHSYMCGLDMKLLFGPISWLPRGPQLLLKQLLFRRMHRALGQADFLKQKRA